MFGKLNFKFNLIGVIYQVSVRLQDGSDVDIEFDTVVVAAGGDGGHVGDLLGIGQGQGELR